MTGMFTPAPQPQPTQLFAAVVSECGSVVDRLFREQGLRAHAGSIPVTPTKDTAAKSGAKRNAATVNVIVAGREDRGTT